MEETKIIYHIDDEETPYLVKIPKAPEKVTLGDFKNVLNRPNYKFFFKSMDDDFGVVKEEIVDDDAPLPAFNQRVVSWIVSADTSVADSLSQCGEEGAPKHQAYQSSGGESGGGGGLDDTTCTETESVISSRRDRGHMRPPRLPKFDKPQERPFPDRMRVNGHNGPGGRGYESSSMISSDLDTTTFFDSDDDASSRITATTTGSSSVSQIHARNRRKKRRHPGGPGGSHRHPHHPHHHQALSHASSISSITDSTMSLNIITVSLNMDSVNFLGISIVGQSSKGGDGGIYVGSIMKGGAVALDGRIEPGDMILQVNDINFENMSNDGAVRVLRDVVQKTGPIKLVVAKCWDPHPPKGYFTVPRAEPVHPIDPGAWIAHTQACLTVDEYPVRPPSASTLTSNTSSLASSVVDTERPYEEMKLSVTSPMTAVVRAMAAPDSGLEIRDRLWLKITIPNAFIGNEVVDWLHQRVEGFSDRKDARKYAAQLLKSGLIKHTVNKRDFSEQCYYVFGDFCDSLAALKLDGEDSISDLGLPPPSATSQWGSNMGSVAPHVQGANFPPSTVAVGGYMQPHQPPNFNYTNESYMFNRDSGSGGSSSGTAKKASQHRSPLQSGGSDSEAASQITASSVRLPPAMVGGVPPMPTAPPQQLMMHHHHHHYQPRPPPPLPHQPLPPIPPNLTAHPPMTNASSQLMTNTSSSSPLVPPSNGSCASSGGAGGGGGGGSSGSERSHGAGGVPNTGLSSSVASFSRAMANPCDYFIDSV